MYLVSRKLKTQICVTRPQCVKERVELQLLPLWAFVACSWENFTFHTFGSFGWRGTPEPTHETLQGRILRSYS